MNGKMKAVLAAALAVLLMGGAVLPAAASGTVEEKSSSSNSSEKKKKESSPSKKKNSGPIEEPTSGPGYDSAQMIKWNWGPDIAWDAEEGYWIYVEYGITKVVYPDGSWVTLDAPEPTEGHGSESALRTGAVWVPMWEAWLYKQNISGTIVLIYPGGNIRTVRDEEQIAIAHEILADWEPVKGEGKKLADRMGAAWDWERSGWTYVDKAGKTMLIRPNGSSRELYPGE